jgi:hypothetical protein
MKLILLTFCLAGASFICCAQQPEGPDTVYLVGNGVSRPRAIYTPEPDLSKEPKADKYNGKPWLLKLPFAKMATFTGPKYMLGFARPK